MTFPFDPSAIPGHHAVHYKTLDAHRGHPELEVDVHATPEEIQDLMRDGYLVRPALVTGADLQRLRDALDEVIARDAERESGRETFSGTYVRHCHDKHPAFMELIDFPPALSVARAVMGPILSLRVFTGRACRPGDAFTEIEWHLHQRMIPVPRPPMWCRPQTFDCLLYLDDIDEGNGPLAVMPGSHEWLDSDLDAFDTAPKDGEVVLQLPAGSLVMAFGSLWHRALPTDGTRSRRLLLFAYAPAWLKPTIVGRKPEGGLSAQVLAAPDVSIETKELLGVAGWM